MMRTPRRGPGRFRARRGRSASSPGAPYGQLPLIQRRNFRPERSKPHVDFVIYAIGFLILLAGLIYGAALLGVPTQWIVVGALVLLGLGIAMGVGKTRRKTFPPITA